MDRTLIELQRIVKEYEDTLNQVREGVELRPYADTDQSAKASLVVLAMAHKQAAELEPFLPFQDSVLPALLALRKTEAVINESHAYIECQSQYLDQARRRLEAEEASLEEQKMLQAALKKRIQSLRQGLETRTDMSPDQIAQEQFDEQRQKKEKYDTESTKLIENIRDFIANEMGAMLAAEELGGPVVGDRMDIDVNELSMGFTSRSKPKRAKVQGVETDQRERRNHAFWGPKQASYDQSQNEKEARNKASAAAEELLDLLESLFNKLTGSGGDSLAAYVKIARESAATRFLVRSKVAEFHPKDATRLRLVDFGRDLDG